MENNFILVTRHQSGMTDFVVRIPNLELVSLVVIQNKAFIPSPGYPPRLGRVDAVRGRAGCVSLRNSTAGLRVEVGHACCGLKFYFLLTSSSKY